MVKVMQALFFLGGMCSAAASHDAVKETSCALDGAQAVQQISKLTLNIWAATQRCKNDPPQGNPLSVKCEVDIASAIQAANDMVMIIINAVHHCGGIHTENYKCGMAVGGLTSAATGLASSTGGLVSDCATPPVGTAVLPKSAAPKPKIGRATTVGSCFSDAEGTVYNLFAAAHKLSKVTKHCKEGSSKCARNSLYIISAFANMGSALASAVSDCDSILPTGNSLMEAQASCASSVLGAAATLHGLAEKGMEVGHECKVDESRLFELEQDEEAPVHGPTNLLMFAAFLPIAAVFGFVAGSKFAKSRAVYIAARDQQLMNVEDDP